MDKKTTIIIIGIILILAIISYFVGFNPINYYKFKIVFINAGKADSTVVVYKDKTYVIDTGEEDNFDRLETEIKSTGKGKVDVLILTHFDKDHIGCAYKLIEKYDIKEVYQSNVPKDSEYYSKYIEVLNKKNITPNTIEGDKTIEDDKFKMVINGPDKVYEDDPSNNSSLIISIKYNNKSFLLMGDALNDRMEDYMKNHFGKYDIIKLPHHGDYLKQDDKLIEVFKPKGVIVSSNDIDKKLKSLIEEKKLELYYTADSDGYMWKEW